MKPKNKIVSVHRQYEKADIKGDGEQLFEVLRHETLGLHSTFRVQIYLGKAHRTAMIWYWNGTEWTSCHHFMDHEISKIQDRNEDPIEDIRRILIWTAVTIIHGREMREENDED